MSEQEQTTGSLVLNPEDAAAPARQTRTFTPVISDRAIMDTARLEHLVRVANVMARAGLMPQSLTHVKDGPGENAKLVELQFEVQQARAVLIANQADLWGADPIAVAQCTSIVHGKLMYEGKLVHAVISSTLSVDLIYEFGRYDISKRDIVGKYENDPETGERVWVGEMPTSVDDQTLGVRVKGTLPGEKQPRTIAGSVGMWHTGAKGPWQKATAWPRQLRYMGAREWCRAYKPSLMLGIITDDEVEEYTLAREVGAVGPSTPQTLHADFTDPRKAELIEGPAKPRRAAKKAREPEPEPEAETESDASGADGAQDGQESRQEPEKALEGEVVGDTIATGHAAKDEVYLHADFPTMDDGRRVTFKNGERFSTVKDQSALTVYAEHAPEVVLQTEAEGTGGSDDQDDETSALPPEFAAYIKTVEAAPSWVDVKKAMQGFYTTEYFKQLKPEQQNQIRGNTWDAVNEATYSDKPDHAADVSAFRLWIEWIEDPDAITGTLRVLEGEPAFAQKDDAFKGAIRNAVDIRCRALQSMQG